MRAIRTIEVAALLAATLSVGCAGDASRTPAPSPTSTPDPTPPVSSPANMAGTWTGTLESPNGPTRTVSATFVQTTNCVDGAWGTVPSEWAGAISGYAGVGSFSGLMSFEGSGSGGRCTESGTLTGEVDDKTMTFSWTPPTIDTGSCAGVFPQSAALKLRRQ